MKKSIKISIPEPCHENWNAMTPTEKGKFCSVCTKEVIDFTQKTDEAIYKHLQTSGNLCGHFKKSQLHREIAAPRKEKMSWLSYAASLLFPLIAFSQNNVDTKKPTIPIEQTTSTEFKPLRIGSLHKRIQEKSQKVQDSIITKGTILDENKIPLPGATIWIKGTKLGTTTDFDGNFEIKTKIGNTLLFQYVGYVDQEYFIKNDENINISLILDKTLEEIVVFSGYVRCYDYPKNTLTPEEKEALQKRKARTSNYFNFLKKKRADAKAKRKASRKVRREKISTKN